MTFPAIPGKTYPEPDAPDWRYRSAAFEALERTFTLAGPLIHVDPETTIGHTICATTTVQIYNAFTRHTNSLPLPEELPDSTYQFTCEFSGLFKTLLLPDARNHMVHLHREQKEEMAVCISKWAHHRTTQNNWRIFNIITLSFLKKHGYEIDDELLKSHLLWVASLPFGQRMVPRANLQLLLHKPVCSLRDHLEPDIWRRILSRSSRQSKGRHRNS